MVLGLPGICLGMGKEIFIFEPLCLFYLRLKEGKIVCVLRVSLVHPGKEPGSQLSLLSDLPLTQGSHCCPPYTGTGKCFCTQIQICDGTQDCAVSHQGRFPTPWTSLADLSRRVGGEGEHRPAFLFSTPRSHWTLDAWSANLAFGRLRQDD